MSLHRLLARTRTGLRHHRSHHGWNTRYQPSLQLPADPQRSRTPETPGRSHQGPELQIEVETINEGPKTTLQIQPQKAAVTCDWELTSRVPRPNSLGRGFHIRLPTSDFRLPSALNYLPMP